MNNKILEEVQSTLDSRGKQYGSYEENSTIAIVIQDLLSTDGLKPTKRYAINMIVNKLVRDATGEPKKDNFIDIIGYCVLALECMDKEEEEMEETPTNKMFFKKEFKKKISKGTKVITIRKSIKMDFNKEYTVCLGDSSNYDETKLKIKLSCVGIKSSKSLYNLFASRYKDLGFDSKEDGYSWYENYFGSVDSNVYIHQFELVK